MTFETAELRNVADLQMGTAPKGSTYNTDGVGTPLIAGAGDYGDVNPIPKKWTTEPTRVTAPGDLIVCIRATIGDLNWADDVYCLGRGVAGVRVDPAQLDANFLAHYLDASKRALMRLGTGTTFLAIRRGDLEKFPIPLPSLDEQNRIAEVLDRAEALRARRRAALALLDELTQSIFLDMFGDPLPNPKEWQVVKLKEVLQLITYGLTVRPKYVPDGIPLISGKEIRGGTIDFDAAAKMSESAFEGLSDKAKPSANDVLFSKTGSIGHTALVDTERVFALAQNVARLTFDASKVNNVFALHFLRSTSVQRLAQSSVRGNAVKDLQLGVMGDFPFILPPLEAQSVFAKRIGSLSGLSLTHQRATDGCDELFASLQSRAFKGEL